MDLGLSEKVKPLVAAVKDMVDTQIAPLDAEFRSEVGKGGDRFVYTPRMTEILESLKADLKWVVIPDWGHRDDTKRAMEWFMKTDAASK